MTKLRVHNFTLSIDGYAAGPEQSQENPLGVGGSRLHDWVWTTRTMRQTFDMDGGVKGLDDDFAAEGDRRIGASIMGGNMFGPIRGSWGDGDWTGWWGENPPFHHPVFVLTHHPRATISMQGGTTFHFTSDGIQSAVEQAAAAANGDDVRIAGGVDAIRQILRVGLIDEMHLVIAPMLLGGGERLFDDLPESAFGYNCVEHVSSPAALHTRFAVRRG